MVFSMPVINEIDDYEYWYTVLEETVLPLSRRESEFPKDQDYTDNQGKFP